MDRAVTQWLSQATLSREITVALTKKLNKSYTIYGQMLLLPPTALSGPEWEPVNLHDYPLESLYQAICTHLKVTHIAMKKPIPLTITTTSSTENFNLLRSPQNFTPLHNDFGPATSSSPPRLEDFDAASWVTAKQNGIFQVWAPRWTMFSRGNISEKARLLTLPSVRRAVEEGECAAVDLFAGVGYFAFCYVKVGVRVVVCWDISGWSCEGLKRGARRNGWEVSSGEEDYGGEARLVVFNESNFHAPARMERLIKKGLPPVRHVNCGMLPSSREALELAAKGLDATCDGWVHVHENFLVEEIERKAEDTRAEMQVIVSRERERESRVELECVNRLKSYAPGVMHCVLDIIVYAKPPSYCYGAALCMVVPVLVMIQSCVVSSPS